MTFEELLQTSHNSVQVLSYGYTEGRVLSHYEPFSKQRAFTFSIDRENECLKHSWLHFYNENREDFYEKNGTIYCNDPELWAKAEY